MHILGRVISALRALPERTRFFLAGVVLFFAGIFIFISWSAVTASHFASLSRVFAPAGDAADSQKELENPGSIFEQLKSGFRDMGSLFQGGILPDLSPDSGQKPGSQESSAGTTSFPSLENQAPDSGEEGVATSSSMTP